MSEKEQKMQYYDFTANWPKVYDLLTKNRIVWRMMEERGLDHPLYCHSHGNGMRRHVLDLVNDDLERQAETEEMLQQCDNSDCGNDGETCNECDELFDKIFEKYEKKHTQPDMMHVSIPEGRCHTFAHVLFAVANSLHPDWNWILVTGDKHSTVYCEEKKIVFDLVFYFYNKEYIWAKHETADYVFNSANGIGEVNILRNSVNEIKRTNFIEFKKEFPHIYKVKGKKRKRSKK